MPLFVLGVFIGLFGAGLLNGWWSALLGNGAEVLGVPGEVVLPTPIRMARKARLLDPATVGLSANQSRTLTATGETIILTEQAPSFALPGLFDQETIYSLSDYRGRPVILNFWASWCVPCRREMPVLQATAAGYEADGLVLLGMNQTYIDDLAEARTFVEELGLTFANTRDDSGAVGAGAYRVAGIPTSVFINRGGGVVHIQIGEMSLEQITRYTDRLIAGQPLQP